MAKDIIFLEDEKIVRNYNVFKGKAQYADKKGIDLIVTNKRVIVKTYNNDIFNRQLNIRETLLTNLSGDINVSANHKISLLKVILFVILAMVSIVVFVTGIEGEETIFAVIGAILALLFIGCIVVAFMFPETEGKIAIYNTNALKDGIFISGGSILKAKEDVVRIIDIEKGKDFDLLQIEIGYLLIELKKGTDVDELIQKIGQNKQPNRPKENKLNQNSQNVKRNYYDDDDDEIPLI